MLIPTLLTETDVNALVVSIVLRGGGRISLRLPLGQFVIESTR